MMLFIVVIIAIVVFTTIDNVYKYVRTKWTECSSREKISCGYVIIILYMARLIVSVGFQKAAVHDPAKKASSLRSEGQCERCGACHELCGRIQHLVVDAGEHAAEPKGPFALTFLLVVRLILRRVGLTSVLSLRRILARQVNAALIAHCVC